MSERYRSQSGISWEETGATLAFSKHPPSGYAQTWSVAAITALAFWPFVAPAVTLAQNAYVTNSGANTVSVISTATKRLSAPRSPSADNPLASR